MAEEIKVMTMNKGTASAWANQVRALETAELGYDTDNKTLKVGDGATSFGDLARLLSSIEIATEADIDDESAQGKLSTLVLLKTVVAAATEYATQGAPGVIQFGTDAEVASGLNTNRVASIFQMVTRILGLLATDEDIALGTAIDKTASVKQLMELLKKNKPYRYGEFVEFINPTLPAGFAPRYGGILSSADSLYPELYEYLQTAEGQLQCITLAQWTTMSNAWSGVGGVPFFVLDTSARSIRLPDTRGMLREDAGFDGLDVLGVHQDMIRNIVGSFPHYADSGDAANITGVFSGAQNAYAYAISSGGVQRRFQATTFNASTKVPTGNANKPRAFGVLPCVYVGGAA